MLDDVVGEDDSDGANRARDPRAPTEHRRRHRETECDRRPRAIHAQIPPRDLDARKAAPLSTLPTDPPSPADPTFRLWTTRLGPRRLRDLGHTRDSRGERPLTQQSPTGSRTHEAAHRPGRRRSPQRRRARRRTPTGQGSAAASAAADAPRGHGDQRLPHERARSGHDRRRSRSATRSSAPPAASRSHRVPMIMHSHGWGGSRTKDPAAFDRFLKAGYGVLSFDQRGFGESGGHAYVENPAVEGHDVRRLVRLVSRLGWVQQDGRGDPRLGAIGGSYGGGYQFLGAFEELRMKGKPVFDALAPEITWFDLNQSLAPEEVVRTAWAAALSAASVPSDALPPNVYAALAEGAATGFWPDGSVPGTENIAGVLREERPAVARRPRPPARHPGPVRPGHHRLALPAAAGPGQLEARDHPARPAGTASSSATTAATCSPPSSRGASTSPPTRAAGSSPAAPSSTSRSASSTSSSRTATPACAATAAPPRHARQHLHDACDGRRRTRRTPSAPSPRPRPAGAPLPYKVAEGPIRIAGSSYLTGTLTALGANNRAFYGLAVGTSPADAHLVQNNVLPLNELAPVAGEKRRIALPAGGGRRARGTVAVRPREPGQRHVRRHGQPDAGCGRAGEHGGPPPRRGALTDLPCRGMSRPHPPDRCPRGVCPRGHRPRAGGRPPAAARPTADRGCRQQRPRRRRHHPRISSDEEPGEVAPRSRSSAAGTTTTSDDRHGDRSRPASMFTRWDQTRRPRPDPGLPADDRPLPARRPDRPRQPRAGSAIPPR